MKIPDSETSSKIMDIAWMIYRYAERWNDESAFESFSDYQNAIKARMPEGSELVKLVFDPIMDVEFVCNGCAVKVSSTPKGFAVELIDRRVM